ncbi:hypothetical protein [Tuwongella immobilis]|uniref:Uncharacterized protein n=1 Tax=Tuwongella immobilis TaxID=692036 RepID=A0A6C2YSA6_9BACT|nr:hypothetical protein [Tuwongella immobilis]VIP04558.1 unnamed protein product [Tuwongella immobilis]VTS06477.1 unnamed protein product [Tuwongella immobilis]
MDGAMIILMGISICISLLAFISVMLDGGTRAKPSHSGGEMAQILDDLGPLVASFSNQSPWRLRAGLLMLLVGLTAGGIAQTMMVAPWVLAIAIAGLLFGTVTLLYVAFAPVHRLQLHTRGLLLIPGRSPPMAVYYSDIRNLIYLTVQFENNGLPGRPIAKNLLIEIHDAGGIEIGADFVGFLQLAEVIHQHQQAILATGELVGSYRIRGTSVQDGQIETITLEARSPAHARQEALTRYGILAQSCEKLAE